MRKAGIAQSAFLILGLAALTATAQVSELYLNDWSTTATFVVQNGQVVRQFNRSAPSDGPGLVVTDTIKMIGQDGGQVGRQYGLDGTPMGGRYTNPSFTSLYDGATDGNNNWSIAHNDFDTNFALVEGDADWNNLQVLFVPARRSSGVTYDPTTDTFWVGNNVGSTDRIQQYDRGGNLVSEFNVQIPGGYGIALDPADNTLWIPGSFGTNDLFQYDKRGNLLQRITVPGLTNQILGAEFGAGSGGRCTYSITKSKAKGGCDECPQRGDPLVTEERCEEPSDCQKKVKTTINCPNGRGTCKLKAKRDACA